MAHTTNNKASERDANVDAAQEALRKGLQALVTGEDWRTMLAVMARDVRSILSPIRYSFNNQMIVSFSGMVRGLDASAVGTFRAFNKLGRTVRPEYYDTRHKHAVHILAPKMVPVKVMENGKEVQRMRLVGFRAIPVYLLGQTDGPALPEPAKPVRPTLPDDVPGFADHVAKLRECALAIKDAPVASVEIRARRAGEHPNANGWFQPSTRGIVVVDSGNQAAMFKTLVHEIAHAIMHGGGMNAHAYAWNEVEAESVAFVVSSVFGLDTAGYSFPYVATWATASKEERDPLKIVNKSGDRIAKAARTILDALLGPVESGEE